MSRRQISFPSERSQRRSSCAFGSRGLLILPKFDASGSARLFDNSSLPSGDIACIGCCNPPLSNRRSSLPVSTLKTWYLLLKPLIRIRELSGEKGGAPAVRINSRYPGLYAEGIGSRASPSKSLLVEQGPVFHVPDTYTSVHRRAPARRFPSAESPIASRYAHFRATRKLMHDLAGAAVPNSNRIGARIVAENR